MQIFFSQVKPSTQLNRRFEVSTCRHVSPSTSIAPTSKLIKAEHNRPLHLSEDVVVVVDPTPPTCCQQSPAPESCGSQQSLPPGGKERLHFVGIRPEVQARKGGW